MLTELGKELRKLRIDRGLTMMDMAGELGYSTAMLSGIETGRKRVPEDVVDRLMRAYPDLGARRDQFEALVNLANREARVSLSNATTEDAELVTELARRFSTLSNEQKDNLRNLLKRSQ
ncbi:MAG: XRE family transcriptional regulator [Rhodocyclaceae bacterium]|nr:MAG: XRE family transcriptional regulator [Rhodocyclaceae bacterium]